MGPGPRHFCSTPPKKTPWHTHTDATLLQELLPLRHRGRPCGSTKGTHGAVSTLSHYHAGPHQSLPLQQATGGLRHRAFEALFCGQRIRRPRGGFVSGWSLRRLASACLPVAVGGFSGARSAPFANRHERFSTTLFKSKLQMSLLPIHKFAKPQLPWQVNNMCNLKCDKKLTPGTASWQTRKPGSMCPGNHCSTATPAEPRRHTRWCHHRHAVRCQS